MEHAFTSQVSKRVHSEVSFDLLNAQACRDQLILGISVDAVEAGMGNRRGAYAHVNLLGTGFPKGMNKLATGGAAHNRVVHHNDALTFKHIR